MNRININFWQIKIQTLKYTISLNDVLHNISFYIGIASKNMKNCKANANDINVPKFQPSLEFLKNIKSVKRQKSPDHMRSGN